MLSAFTARPILELKQRDKNKIEAVVLHGDRLFTGLSTGALRIYRVNENASDSAASTGSRPSTASKLVELLREIDRFSRYRIEQLAVIKEANVLASLSNGTISLHDLASYELQDTFTKAKGATLFAVTSNVVRDQTTDIPEIVSRLAVAVKRRLLIWTWRDGALSDDCQEISQASTIRTLTWVRGTRLVAGLASNYAVIDIEASTAKDVVGPGAIGGGVNPDAGRFSGVGVSSLMGGLGPAPLATRLTDGQVLLARDINTHFIDTDGQSLGRRQIPWSQAPDAVGYSYPYLLALQTTKGTLEIRNPETLRTLQSISLQNAKILHVPNPGVSLAHAGKGFLVASERCIWRMDALQYDAQIDSLVELGEFDEAVSLLDTLEDALLKDKPGRLREIKMLKAEHLFHQKKFRKAFDIFLDIHAPPKRVVRLFPQIISGDDAEQLDRSATKGSVEAEAPDNKSTKEGSEDTFSTTAKADTASLAGSLRRTLGSSTTEDSGLLAGKDLKSAAVELNSFLVDTRTRIQRVLDYENNELKDAQTYPEVSAENQALMAKLDPAFDDGEVDEGDKLDKIREIAKLVDNALFRSYMFAAPQMAGYFFRLPNFTDADVAEEKLLESKRYTDLIDFLYGKGLHGKALEVLERFARDESEENVPEQLRGPQRMITYLQNVPPENIDLILKHIQWPLETAPESAMEVFIADTCNAEHLPRDKVLDYLAPLDVALAAKYLEHVITELNETDPELHQRLIQLYLDALNEADGDSKPAQLDRLVAFLKSSRRYEPWRVIRILPKEEEHLLEPRAIVLGRMQEHKQALEIYVFEMHDPIKAEDYCNQVWVEQHQQKTQGSEQSPRRGASKVTVTADPQEEKSTVYHILLSLYLKPRSPRTQQLGPALDLLARHGSRLPASSTLDLLPENLKVEQLESYFRGRIRSANAVCNQAKIVAGLRKTVDQESNLELRLDDPKGRNRSVIVTEDRICGVCHRRFALSQAINVTPGNVVVHYSCKVR